MSENTDTSNDSNSLFSASSTGASQETRSGTTNPLLRAGVLRPSVLGPSVLGTSLSNSTSTTAGASDKHDFAVSGENDAKNPFLKSQQELAEEEESGAVADKSIQKTKNDDIDDRPDPLTLLRKNETERINIFTTAKTMPYLNNAGFVFGQNVHERVKGDNIIAEKNPLNPLNAATSGSTTSGSELLFSSVIQNASQNSENTTCGSTTTETKSLTQVAREYEESRAQKRKYEEVETFTGEENEINIVDVNCKLFAFVNSNWEERGRGSLRLNDAKNERECSRVVFRTAGNLRLLLNTKVWAGMVAERPSGKSMRITAMEQQTGKIKVFLAMGRPIDIDQLHDALTERIEIRKRTHPHELSDAVFESNSNGAAKKNESDESTESADVHNNDDAADKIQNCDDNYKPSPKKAIITGSAAGDSIDN